MEQIRIEPGNDFSFTAVEADGPVHDAPFHRVREVRRDGERIRWREVGGEAGPAA